MRPPALPKSRDVIDTVDRLAVGLQALLRTPRLPMPARKQIEALLDREALPMLRRCGRRPAD